ncbi:cation transport ATPase [Halobacteroides halobius DSM 5150]|uniref:Cation transport ATPase n=1 Tax=Halobacteroides halobius (strain ATCC 35273 / DSM 5150 / MD-1) TaxID=748449 RepID=L0KAH4_HALHC|nr:cation transport ATPase [Halobacteroides halobius DSM 5150]
MINSCLGGVKLETANFKVKGITSPQAKSSIESALNKLEGVSQAKFNLKQERQGQVNVKFDKQKTKLKDLKTEVRATGYEVS